MKQKNRILSVLLILALLLLIGPTPTMASGYTATDVYDMIDWIIASIPDDCETDYEIALYLYDYLCENVEYVAGKKDYAALLYGEADCEGYTDAYKRLLLAAGIYSAYVTGYAPHAWNMVVIDGECYFTDVSAGDVDYYWSDDMPNYVHSYFNLSYAEMQSRGNKAEKLLNAYPGFRLDRECTHTKYRYTYKDTGEPGSAYFNNDTTPQEAAQYFKPVLANENVVYLVCEFEFDGNARQWVDDNHFWIGKELDASTIVYIGDEGCGVFVYEAYNYAYTPIETLTFTEPVVTLNNSNMRKQLSVNYAPANASFQEVTYSSSDSRIAKVDENGVVRAVSSGIATITATAIDGATATCQVVVDHQHDAIREVPATEPTCRAKGYKAHYICDSCGTRFSDSAGNNVVPLREVVRHCVPHSTQTVVYDDLEHWHLCACGHEISGWRYEHSDDNEDGYCDGAFCGYVVNPAYTKPATQPATKPTQPTTQPTQPPTQPTTQPVTQPATQPETIPTVPTVPAEPETTPTAQPTTGSVSTTMGSIPTTKPTAGTTHMQPASPGASEDITAEPPIFRWIGVGLLGVAAVIVIILAIRKRKKD